MGWYDVKHDRLSDMKIDNVHFDKAEIDSIAFHILRNWYKNELLMKYFVYRGINLGELVESKLWSILPRILYLSASRKENDSEIKKYIRKNYCIKNYSLSISIRNIFYFFSKAHYYLFFPLRLNKEKKSVILIDYNERIEKIRNKLKRVYECDVFYYENFNLFKQRRAIDINEGYIAVDNSSNMNSRLYKKKINKNFKEIEIQLKNEFLYQGVDLYKHISPLLKYIIIKEFPRRIAAIDNYYKLFESNRYKAVIQFMDNKMHQKTSIFVANCLNIPTIQVQHGLDCDDQIYRLAFAQHIIVWGEERKGRYLQQNNKNKNFYVAGNPNFIDFERFQAKLSKEVILDAYFENKVDDYLVLITAANGERKLYSCFKNKYDGVNLLDAVSSSLSGMNIGLIVKPHPYEDLFEYDKVINRYIGKVAIKYLKEKHSYDLIVNSNGVVGQSSTMIIESALLGKKCVVCDFKGVNNIDYEKCLNIMIASSENRLKEIMHNFLLSDIEVMSSDLSYFVEETDMSALNNAVSVIKSIVENSGTGSY